MANLTIGNKSADSSYSLLLDANLKVLNSQAEEVDLISTAASVASDSLARLQAASVYTVYNAIPSWARSSTKPTYTAAEVGAVPTSRTVNGQSLNSNVTLTAANVGAVPTSRKVNNKSLNSDISLTASDVGAVPTTRTVNGQALSSDISLSAADISAVAANQSATNSGKILAVGSDGAVVPTSTIDGNLNVNGRITTPDEKGIISRSGVRPLYIQPNQTKTFALYPNSPAVIFIVRSGRDSIFMVTYWDSGARQLVGATTPSVGIVHAASAGTFTIENQGTNWIGVIVLGATYEGEDEDVWR